MAVPHKGQIIFRIREGIRTRQIAASQTTLAVGDPVGFDSNGKVIKAVDTTDGPLGVITAALDADGTTQLSGASAAITGASDVKFAEVMFNGVVVMVSGGAIKPFKWVGVASDSEVIALAKGAISATPTEAELEAAQNEVWRKLGQYWGKATDDGATVADAADQDLIKVRIGGV